MHKFFILALATIFLTAACSGPSIITTPKAPKKPDPTTRATYFLKRGDYRGAAQEYFRLAKYSRPPQSGSYYMTGVELLIRANLIQEARAWLNAFISHNQDPSQSQRIQLALAEIELSEGKNASALNRLMQISPQKLTAQQRKSYYHLSATVLEREKRILDAARMRIALDPMLNVREMDYNHKQLWAALMSLAPGELSQLTLNEQDNTTRGWFALAFTAKTTGPRQLSAMLEDWRGRFPQHPAQRDILAQLAQGSLDTGGFTAAQGNHIALLLPLQGSLKHAAAAVRDGFIAARYQDTQGSDVQVYEASAANIINVYAEALQKGAHTVVGPLEKNALLALAAAYPRLPVPTLALNNLSLEQYSGTSLPANLYQFSLSPEDEAREAANWGWEDGHRRAAALVPNTERGRRLLDAFSRHWQQLGGELVDTAFYKEPAMAGPIKQILSHKAYLDMVFVVGSPREGRQIRPYFLYYFAGRLPLYATSQIYSGTVLPKVDNDLDGVRFVETPWLLKDPRISPEQPEDTLYTSLKNSGGGNAILKRLVAFGIDAYHLSRNLHLLDNPSAFYLQGQSGGLYVDDWGVVHRRLERAWFRRGRPEIIHNAVGGKTPVPALSAELNRP